MLASRLIFLIVLVQAFLPVFVWAQPTKNTSRLPQYELRGSAPNQHHSQPATNHPAYLGSNTGASVFLSPSDSTIIPVSNWSWGECYTVDLYQDSFAVIGNGRYVHVLNIARVDSPCVVGEYYTGMSVRDLVIRGSLAYVVTGNELMVLDLTNPLAPVKVGEVQVTSSSTFRIVIEDTLAYITAYWHLTVVDIKNPYDLHVRGIIGLGEGFVYHAVRNGIVYIGYAPSANGTFPSVIDCRDPGNLKDLGSFMSDGLATGVFVKDTLLYAVGSFNSGHSHFLRVFSVSVPDSPKVVSTLSIPYDLRSSFFSVFVLDTIAYVSTGSYAQDISTFSVSNPRSIIPIKTVTRNNARGSNVTMASDGNRLVVAQLSGLWLLGDLDSLHTLSYFMTGGIPSDVEVWENYAFLVQPDAGITVLDISDLAHLKRVGAFEPPKTTIGSSLDWIMDMEIDSPSFPRRNG